MSPRASESSSHTSESPWQVLCCSPLCCGQGWISCRWGFHKPEIHIRLHGTQPSSHTASCAFKLSKQQLKCTCHAGYTPKEFMFALPPAPKRKELEFPKVGNSSTFNCFQVRTKSLKYPHFPRNSLMRKGSPSKYQSSIRSNNATLLQCFKPG